MKDAFKIIVCASGGGGNFQALVDARNQVGFNIESLIVDRNCNAISRAVAAGIPYVNLNLEIGSDFPCAKFENLITDEIDLIVLAGFMPILPRSLCEKWPKKIINTHPSLLPKYGGKGMYGVKVQEAVIMAKEKEAGCTVHYVNAEIDGGQIILQKKILVESDDSPWSLGGRIFKEENLILVQAVKLIKEQTYGEQPNES